MNVTPRQKALIENKAQYVTGLPCLHGHIASRFVSSRRCVVCARLSVDRSDRANPEKKISRLRAWRRDNSEAVKTYSAAYAQLKSAEISVRMKAWRKKNRKALSAYNRKWLENNSERRVAYRQKNKVAAYRYRRTHSALYSAYAATRRARLLQAVPVWADIKAINIFYEGCPSGMHVDHEIPLCGGTVCGLHTVNNLRYLTMEENVRRPRKYNVNV